MVELTSVLSFFATLGTVAAADAVEAPMRTEVERLASDNTDFGRVVFTGPSS